MENAFSKPDRHPLAVLPLPESAIIAVTSCTNCGVCCREVVIPPFLDDIDFIPRDLQKEILDAQKREAELLAAARPCIWFNEATGLCRHHEHRPNVCREYPVGEELCLEARARFGITG